MRDKLEDFKLRWRYSVKLVKSAAKHRRHSNTWKYLQDEFVWTWTVNLDAYCCCNGWHPDNGSCGCYGLTNRDVLGMNT